LEKKSVMALVTASVGAASNVALNFILIPLYGAMGAAIATAVSYAVVFVMRVLNTRRYLKFKISILKAVIKSIPSFTVSGKYY
jgi:O-antigen/teichoic acid export membrane protein